MPAGCEIREHVIWPEIFKEQDKKDRNNGSAVDWLDNNMQGGDH